MNLREQLERASGAERNAWTGRRVEWAALLLLAFALATVTTLGLDPRIASRTPTELLGALLTNMLLFIPAVMALAAFDSPLLTDRRALSLIAGGMGIVLLSASFTIRLLPDAPELVPVAFFGIVSSAVFGRRFTFTATLFLAMLLAAQPAFRALPPLPMFVAAGSASALIVRPSAQRDQSYVWMLVIALVVGLALVVTSASTGLHREDLPLAIARAGGVSVVCVIGAMLLMPLVEAWTGRETHLTLLEWGDLNRPLLQRLSLEAPGTYAHTIAIANLAEAACRAIGANALLARVGAYYHDIGKLAKPQYFVENQPRGRNLHDKLKPQTSASIIRNHIREGLELAEAERIPKSIRAFIAEHHGTGSISFFLEKARERDGVTTNAAEFTYPGPVPQTAESAVVMLADGVEAATRALTDATPDRIREVIDAVVRQRIDQGQLRDAPLTLRDLSAVKREFARVLGGMYHGRVEYPTPAPSLEAIPR